MEIDLISDIHIDMWLYPHKNQDRSLEEFIMKMIPYKPSEILIIAGDLGHFNSQNESMLKIFSGIYKKVLWTHGNHDLYLISKDQKNRYINNSFNKLNDMIRRSNNMENVHYLDGTYIKYNGIKFGGCSGWFDCKYIKTNYNMDDDQILKLYYKKISDPNYILIGDSQLDYNYYFNEQNDKIGKLIGSYCDVIFSHYGPDWSRVSYKYKDPTTGFFYFDGNDHLSLLDKNNTWIFGHTHDQIDYRHHCGCRLVCQPFGYPQERRKIYIRTIEV